MKEGLSKLLNWISRKPQRIEKLIAKSDWTHLGREPEIDVRSLTNPSDWMDISDEKDDYELWCNFNPKAKPPGLRFGRWKKDGKIEPWWKLTE